MGEEHSPLMTRLESMSQIEIKELIIRLTYFVQSLMDQKTRWMKRPFLPKGYDASSIAAEALTRVLDGRRRWNPEKDTNLLNYLKSVAKSILWDLNVAAKKESLVGVDEHELSNIPSRGASAEEQLSIDETKAQLLNELQDDDERLVLLAIYDGYEKSADIAENLGIDIKEVYKLKWRIRQHLLGYDRKVGS